MPKTRLQPRPLRGADAFGLRCRLAVGLLAGLVCIQAASGCRAFRCGKASDESIGAARQLSLQAMDARQKGHWDQAEQFYAAAITRCPQDERARCGYAEALWRRGDQTEAVAHMEEAVKLSGNDPERLVELGKMYLALGETRGAATQAERAIAANRQLAGAWALRGDVLKAEGDRNEAVSSYHRALSYQSHYPQVQLALAEIYGQQNRGARALATLQALASYYPPGQVPTEVSFRQGLVLRSLGRHRDATECLAAAAKQGAPSVELLYELAHSQILSGDAANARLTLATAQRRYPEHVLTQQLREDLDGGRGQMAVASGSTLLR